MVTAFHSKSRSSVPSRRHAYYRTYIDEGDSVALPHSVWQGLDPLLVLWRDISHEHTCNDTEDLDCRLKLQKQVGYRLKGTNPQRESTYGKDGKVEEQECGKEQEREDEPGSVTLHSGSPPTPASTILLHSSTRYNLIITSAFPITRSNFPPSKFKTLIGELLNTSLPKRQRLHHLSTPFILLPASRHAATSE
ncbi:hypothetical protein BT69DRAFT_1294171 [Atractiella rhizophila]|nr:hypothetical protein BT69DRAFT_1294171 [Atractiella rhizophila]